MLKHIVKYIVRPSYRKTLIENKELKRIKKQDRYIKNQTNILGNTFTYVDSASFYFIYDEIFKKEIYKFKTSNPIPTIIDAGANIGLGIIYLKKQYPNAKIVAFEPDEKVFEVLELNIKSFNLTNVNLVNKGLWKEETILSFNSGEFNSVFLEKVKA
jgi:tRNA1(Val) A37 N6-methylase TrmN6